MTLSEERRNYTINGTMFKVISEISNECRNTQPNMDLIHILVGKLAQDFWLGKWTELNK